MISLHVRINCDTHRDGEATYEGDWGVATLDRALEAGWRTVNAPSGKPRHLCPECVAERFGDRPAPRLEVVP